MKRSCECWFKLQGNLLCIILGIYKGREPSQSLNHDLIIMSSRYRDFLHKNKQIKKFPHNLKYIKNPLYSYLTQIRDDSTFTSNGVINKLNYIEQHFVAFEARDLILKFSKNSAIMIFLNIGKNIFFHFWGSVRTPPT